MQSAPFKRGIGLKPFDAGEFTQCGYELVAVQLADDLPDEIRNQIHFIQAVFFLIDMHVVYPAVVFYSRKSIHRFVRRPFFQKIIELSMRIGICLLIGFGLLGKLFSTFVEVQNWRLGVFLCHKVNGLHFVNKLRSSLLSGNKYTGIVDVQKQVVCQLCSKKSRN